MAVNNGFEILVDDGESADTKASILRRVLRALENHTMSCVFAATYSAGSTSANESTLNVGTEQTSFSADFGIRVIWDTAVIGTDTTPEVERDLIREFESDTISIAHAASYAAGDRAYNVTITIT